MDINNRSLSKNTLRIPYAPRSPSSTHTAAQSNASYNTRTSNALNHPYHINNDKPSTSSLSSSSFTRQRPNHHHNVLHQSYPTTLPTAFQARPRMPAPTLPSPSSSSSSTSRHVTKIPSFTYIRPNMNNSAVMRLIEHKNLRIKSKSHLADMLHNIEFAKKISMQHNGEFNVLKQSKKRKQPTDQGLRKSTGQQQQLSASQTLPLMTVHVSPSNQHNSNTQPMDPSLDHDHQEDDRVFDRIPYTSSTSMHVDPTKIEFIKSTQRNGNIIQRKEPYALHHATLNHYYPSDDQDKNQLDLPQGTLTHQLKFFKVTMPDATHLSLGSGVLSVDDEQLEDFRMAYAQDIVDDLCQTGMPHVVGQHSYSEKGSSSGAFPIVLDFDFSLCRAMPQSFDNDLFLLIALITQKTIRKFYPNLDKWNKMGKMVVAQSAPRKCVVKDVDEYCMSDDVVQKLQAQIVNRIPIELRNKLAETNDPHTSSSSSSSSLSSLRTSSAHQLLDKFTSQQQKAISKTQPSFLNGTESGHQHHHQQQQHQEEYEEADDIYDDQSRALPLNESDDQLVMMNALSDCSSTTLSSHNTSLQWSPPFSPNSTSNQSSTSQTRQIASHIESMYSMPPPARLASYHNVAISTTPHDYLSENASDGFDHDQTHPTSYDENIHGYITRQDADDNDENDTNDLEQSFRLDVSVHQAHPYTTQPNKLHSFASRSSNLHTQTDHHHHDSNDHRSLHGNRASHSMSAYEDDHQKKRMLKVLKLDHCEPAQVANASTLDFIGVVNDDAPTLHYGTLNYDMKYRFKNSVQRNSMETLLRRSTTPIITPSTSSTTTGTLSPESSSGSQDMDFVATRGKIGMHIHLPHIIVTKSEMIILRLAIVDELTRYLSMNPEISLHTLIPLRPGLCQGSNLGTSNNITLMKNFWKRVIDDGIYGDIKDGVITPPHLRMLGSHKFQPCPTCKNENPRRINCASCNGAGNYDKDGAAAIYDVSYILDGDGQPNDLHKQILDRCKIDHKDGVCNNAQCINERNGGSLCTYTFRKPTPSNALARLKKFDAYVFNDLHTHLIMPLPRFHIIHINQKDRVKYMYNLLRYTSIRVLKQQKPTSGFSPYHYVSVFRPSPSESSTSPNESGFVFNSLNDASNFTVAKILVADESSNHAIQSHQLTKDRQNSKGNIGESIGTSLQLKRAEKTAWSKVDKEHSKINELDLKSRFQLNDSELQSQIQKLIQRMHINWHNLVVKAIFLMDPRRKKSKPNDLISAKSETEFVRYIVFVTGPGSRFCRNVNRQHSKTEICFMLTIHGISQRCNSHTKNLTSFNMCECTEYKEIHMPWGEEVVLKANLFNIHSLNMEETQKYNSKLINAKETSADKHKQGNQQLRQTLLLHFKNLIQQQQKQQH